MKHLGLRKTFMFGLASLLLCFIGCKQDTTPDGLTPKITITIDGDSNLKTGKGGKIEVNKGTPWETVKRDAKITGITFNAGYELGEWKLDNAQGTTLADNYAFQENKTVFATSKNQTQPPSPSTKITITIDGDSNLKTGKGDTIEVDKGTPWETVKRDAKITGITFNAGYELGEWKLDNAQGTTLADNYAFQENKTVFATSKNQTQPPSPSTKITITIDGDSNLKTGKGDTIEVDKGTPWETVKRDAKITGITFNDSYELEEWKLDNAQGTKLVDSYKFQESKTVFATSKTTSPSPSAKVNITVTGDERLDVSTQNVVPVDVNKTFSEVKSLLKEKVSLKSGWSADEYEVYDWKLNDEKGVLLADDYKITQDITVYARTNYSIFNISDTVINKCDMKKKPRGRIIIPKEITVINEDAFMTCTGITNVDFSLCTGLTDICSWAFFNCTGITEMDLTHNPLLTKLVLTDCKKLKTVDLSKNVNLTQVYFPNCEALASIDLSLATKLKRINEDCFKGCTSAIVTLPSSIETIDWHCFGEDEDFYCIKVIVPNEKIKEKVKGSGYPEKRIEVRS